MANAIVLIARIGATRGFFVSDAFGFWIFCVEHAIKLMQVHCLPFRKVATGWRFSLRF
jgi:hypothetical protein